MAFLRIIPARQMMETKKLNPAAQSLKVVTTQEITYAFVIGGVRYFIAGGIPEWYIYIRRRGVWMFLPEGRNKKVYTQDGQIKTKCWCMYTASEESKVDPQLHCSAGWIYTAA